MTSPVPEHGTKEWTWFMAGAKYEESLTRPPLRFRELSELFDALVDRYQDDMDVADWTIVLKMAQIMCPSKLKRRFRIR